MNGGRALAGIAARFLQEQVERARRPLKAVRRGRDAEAVHDLRVASRRIRAALALLREAGVPRARRWRRHVRRLTRSLGRARDLDVRLEFLRSFLRRKGVRGADALTRLERRLARERRSAQGDVLRALRRIEQSGILDSLEEWARRAASGADPRHPAARRIATRQVRRRLRDLEKLSPCVFQEDAADRQHLLRIAAKRLRYTLEIFRPLFGRSLEPRIEALRELQEILGDLHDCDVWLVALAPGDPALEPLRGDRRRRRRILYRRLLRWWEARRKMWEGLRRIASSLR